MSTTDNRLIRDRYWILSTLASGGMGHTYRVWDIQQRIPAVIKIPRRDVRDPENTVRRFVQELHAMLALKHEHIVPITDYGDDGDLPFVVMRFLPGGSLADYRDEPAGTQPSNPPSMLHVWLPGISCALDFMHRHAVLHRDVKPPNIFLDAFLKPYLGDFGIAKAIDESGRMLRGEDLTADHAAVGTAAYMAPEQFRLGEPTTSRSDQYALAVTVYEMLSGRTPFRGDIDKIWNEHCSLPPPPLDVARLRIPRSLHAAVQRALAKKPEQRFATCGEFARSALADVPPLRLAAGVARFLCPGCKSIIRLEVGRAGTAGACRKCRRVLEVAEDLSALWMRDEPGAMKNDSSVDAAAGSRKRKEDAEELVSKLMERLRAATIGLLSWLTSTGAVAILAAVFGGAFAWVANEVRWRSRVAGELAESTDELDRAAREIESLRRQLQSARDRKPAQTPDATRPVQVAPGAPRRVPDDDVSLGEENGRSSLAPGSPLAPSIVVDEDERGLPSPR